VTSNDSLLLHEFIDSRWQDWRSLVAIDVPAARAGTPRLSLTYGDLIARSWSIQYALAPSLTGESIVAVFLPRTNPDAFAALLGLMRAGAAYTGLDPSFPDGRLHSILTDARPVAVLTDRAGGERLRSIGIDAHRLLFVESIPEAGSPPPRPAWLSPSTLAYVIYTSGTTGAPKGVCIEHRAIANLVASDIGEFGLGPGDRVAQNSSLSYDSSVEEMWMALAAGGTVVVMDDETARSGPDLLNWLETEAISVLCPPPTMLRATGARTLGGRVPALKLIYAGGEALTTDVAEIWAPGRRFVNGYGPTECAVVATRCDVVAGEPIAIGRPIPHLTAHVLDDALEDVERGQAGELCLGGAGLARGYLHQAGLSASRFPHHPAHGRLYRTGDLVRQTGDGALWYLGRADSQVKLRGYRVELEEIEAHLARLPGVRAAACRVDGAARATLTAHLVTDGALPSLESVRQALGRTLPTYMLPGVIRAAASLPTGASGKLDRAALPETIDAPSSAVDAHSVGRTGAERQVETTLRRLLGAGAPIALETDFFRELGADSLLAAELVTELRAFPETSGLTVRDAYEAPTIAALGARAGRTQTRAVPAPRRRTPRESNGRPMWVTVAQIAWLAAELLVISGGLGILIFSAVPWLLARTNRLDLLVAVLPLAAALGLLLYVPAAVAVAVAMKRIAIGTYVPSRAPVWGAMYLRNWIVCETARRIPWRLLEGTGFQLAALRALGAKIGRRVHIHRGVDLQQGGWDLLDIGDDVTIGQEVVIRLVDLEDERIVVAAVRIGARSTIEVRASVGGGATIGDGAYITALSSVPAGTNVPAGERWDGVPGRAAGAAPEAPAVDRSHDWSPGALGAAMLAARLWSLLATPSLLALATAAALGSGTLSVSAADLVNWLRAPIWNQQIVLICLACGLASVPLAVVTQALSIRALGRVRPGVISRWNPAYFRIWAKTDLVRRAGDWLSGTLMWPVWLRLAGMKVGRDCEISTIIDVVPELVTIGPHTFFADGVYLGCPLVHRGTVRLSATALGRDVFLGNHVVIPGGCVVPDGVLIGVCTVANDQSMVPTTSWFGHPPFELTRPRATADRALTHEPSPVRVVNRWMWELGRFAIPVVPWLILALGAQLLVRVADARPDTGAWALPLLLSGAGVLMCLLVLALKWGLLGRVRPGEHALWSCWCSRWDFLYMAWGRLARPFLARFEGTLLLAWYLRAMGMRIGRRVVLGGGFAQVVDPDMIQIDDDATVHALFQAHTFEDRMLKIDRVRIRARSNVGCGAVLFYGVDVGEDASVAPQSVIMKRERLRRGGYYEGCPSQPV
jgi:non-ribosomal peptide synthetase-like protein